MTFLDKYLLEICLLIGMLCLLLKAIKTMREYPLGVDLFIIICISSIVLTFFLGQPEEVQKPDNRTPTEKAQQLKEMQIFIDEMNKELDEEERKAREKLEKSILLFDANQ